MDRVSSFTDQFLRTEIGTHADFKRQWVSVIERAYLRVILARFRGNNSMAAKFAGLDRRNLIRLQKKHGIMAAQFRAP